MSNVCPISGNPCIQIKNIRVGTSAGTLDLCQECGQQYLQIGVPEFPSLDAFQKLVQMALQSPPAAVQQELELKQCPQCGMTLADFRARGKMGCPNCYYYYGRILKNLLPRIHGTSEHAGKRPKNRPEPVALGEAEGHVRQALEHLESAVASYAKREEYERCAGLRDVVKSLRTTLGG